MTEQGWLPPLILLTDFGGDWKSFLEAVFQVYLNDFVKARPRLGDGDVRVKRYPECDGKGATFWHLISEGSEEDERLPDLRRCERIRWPRAIIDNSSRPDVLVWSKKHDDGIRVILALRDFSYVVVIAQRRDHFLLLTAYTVEREHRRRKLEREFKETTQNSAGPAP